MKYRWFIVTISYLLVGVIKVNLASEFDLSFIDISYVPLNDNVIEISDNELAFPADFKFGAASASYQIEGGWNADGKSPSIWDTLVHRHPDMIVDGSNGDVSANSYEFYKEDVKALKAVGLNFYRFSISWSRILPDGDISSLNQKGIDYYNRLIDELLAANIEPMVTMSHWDLPQKLEDFGGLMNPMIVDFFTTYADVLFCKFGDRVKHWITFNEPSVNCGGWEYGGYPPLISLPGVGQYLCSHHVILSHASVYRLYDRVYRSKFHGKVGITLSSDNYYKHDPTDPDSVVDRAFLFQLGIFMHPIFKTGDYPQIMIDEIEANSRAEGREKSRLPKFTEEQKKMVLGAADFLGYNYYTSRLTAIDENVTRTDPPTTYKDAKTKEDIDPKWPRAKSRWLFSVPTGIRDGLRWISKEYNKPEIWITENGWSDDGETCDDGRIEYYSLHLLEALKSILIDKINLKGYTFWSVIDNFEWLRGYTEKFGIFSVNFTSPNKERTAKKSASFLHQVIASRKVPT